MAHPIPSFYRIFFSSIDPMVATTGILGNLFAPDQILDSYYPKATAPPSIETTVLLEIVAGFLAGTIVLQIVLLRMRPRDVGLWKCFQASIALVDCIMITSWLKALNVQGRLQPEEWRVHEWTNFSVTAMVGLIRILFVLGVGMPAAKRVKRS